MDERASDSGVLQSVERLLLAGLGAVALTAERADTLADELARRGSITREDARRVIEDARRRWRAEAGRLGERAGMSIQGVLRELGIATRDELDELELRVAQLEHRLRLVEDQPAGLPRGQLST